MRYLISYLFLLTFAPGFAQYPRFIFRNPLGIPMHLIANFGEVRNDHYHMGLDLRTQQRENLPVYAAAEGYISRVTIETGGYGKCIYITHPNGYTTLYAHLNQFFPALQQFVEHRQYHDESWEQDIKLPKGQFPVGKGQYIALSGATGAVEGPHLHFEVRDTKTGNNINPLFLGFPIKDNLRPFIYRLFLYDRNYSTYSIDPAEIIIKGKNGVYTTAETVKTGSSKISFAISAEDVANGSGFRFGIYGAELWMDSVLQFSFKLREFSYENSRYVNASIDYKKWINNKARIQHLSKLPGNRLFVKEGEKDGVIELRDTLPHNISIVVTDAAANESALNYTVQYKPELKEEKFFTQETVKLVPGKKNEAALENIKISFPAAALYDTVDFKSSQISVGTNGLPVYQIGNASVPLHEPYTVEITAAEEQPDSSKVIMRMSGKSLQVIRPAYRSGKFIGSFDRFGVLLLMADTVPPNISTTWADSTVFSKKGSISFTVKDGISSVEKVRGEVDGEWMLFERRGNTYTYRIDEYCNIGYHVLKITAEDIAGNETTRTYNFEVKEKLPVSKKTVKKISKKKNGNTSKRR
jgi:murein DD-endopeptidase MepM/ murein hydrolase activator NlpD